MARGSGVLLPGCDERRQHGLHRRKLFSIGPMPSDRAVVQRLGHLGIARRGCVARTLMELQAGLVERNADMREQPLDNGARVGDERLVPQKGIHYFVSGSGGQLRNGNMRRSEQTAAAFDQDLSFMLVEVAGAEMFFQVISRTGQTVDSGTIRQQEQTQ